MKRLTLLIALLLCLTIASLSIVGCGEKKQEAAQEQAVEEATEEVATDTTMAVEEDTTIVEEEPVQE